MPTKLNPTIPGVDSSHGNSRVDDLLIDEIWHDLAGQVSREQIGEVMTEVAARFHDATVTAFLPIMIRRQTLEKLKAMIRESG